MTSPEPGAPSPTDADPAALLRGLLEPLLDARSQPASERFDQALAVALGAGRITPELARELRFWQRASVHEVSDHIRTVLPVVLPVALAAVGQAEDEAEAAAAGALAVWRERTTTVEPDQPVEPPAGEASDDVEPARDDVEPVEQAAEAVEPQVSTPHQDGAAMSPHVRRRLFVAGLTSTA